jgi:hypothetical protein
VRPIYRRIGKEYVILAFSAKPDKEALIAEEMARDPEFREEWIRPRWRGSSPPS